MIKRISSNLKRLLNILRYKNLDPIEFYYPQNASYVYIENAKVACTSIKKTIFDVNDNEKVDIHDMLRPRALMFPPKGNYLVFSVVRNPFERVVSCYQDKVLKAADQKKKTIFDLLFYKLIFSVFSGKVYRGGNTSFEDFVSMICAVPDWISDRHFRSQSRMLQGNGKPLDEVVFLKLENIESEWQRIEPVVGKSLFVRQNSSKRPLSWKEYYTSMDLVEKVSERYFSDIQLFGYQHAYDDLVKGHLNENN